MDLERLARKVSQCLGCEVRIVYRHGMNGEIPHYLECVDTDLGGRVFSKPFTVPSRYEQEVKIFHESIYKERSRAKFVEQNGLCALCGEPMKGTENTECDHIETRGAHGRDDRLINLRVVHSVCHRIRHGEKRRA